MRSSDSHALRSSQWLRVQAPSPVSHPVLRSVTRPGSVGLSDRIDSMRQCVGGIMIRDGPRERRPTGTSRRGQVHRADGTIRGNSPGGPEEQGWDYERASCHRLSVYRDHGEPVDREIEIPDVLPGSPRGDPDLPESQIDRNVKGDIPNAEDFGSPTPSGPRMQGPIVPFSSRRTGRSGGFSVRPGPGAKRHG